MTKPNLTALVKSQTAFCRVGVVSSYVLHALLVGWSIIALSPAYDEYGHLPSGWCHLVAGRYEAYRVNPPIPRMIAAGGAGIIGFDPPLRQYTDRADDRPEWLFANDLVDHYGEKLDRFFVAGRFALLPISFLGMTGAWRWSYVLYGELGALITVWMWAFFPLMIAYEGLLVPDAFAASTGLLASFALWGFLRAPNLLSGINVSVLLGFAILSKTTLLLLIPLFVFSCCFGLEMSSILRRISTALLLCLGALVVINAGYGFADTCQSLNRYDFTSRGMGTVMAFVDKQGFISSIPIPLPREFLRGIDLQASDFEKELPSYLMGTWARKGWWYYYLVGLIVKSPGIWLALLAAAIWFTPMIRREEIFLLSVPVAVLLFVSSQTGFNHHIRYVLPIFPPLFVFMGRLAHACKTLNRRLLLSAVLLVYPTSSFVIAPYSYAYFNQLSGGSKEGWRWLGDSNIDWGQDLAALRQWARSHPECRPLYVAYSIPFVAPSSVGIPSVPIQLDVQGQPTKLGWYAVFSKRMIEDMRFFQVCEPDFQPTPALRIFDLSADEKLLPFKAAWEGSGNASHE